MPKSNTESVKLISISKLQPDDVSKKIWFKTLDKNERRDVLKRWLEERDFPREHLRKELFTYTCNDENEAMRKDLLCTYMGSEWGSKPYLCYSPATKRMVGQARRRKRAKANPKKQISNAANSSYPIDSATILLPPSLSTTSTIENFSDADVSTPTVSPPPPPTASTIQNASDASDAIVPPTSTCSSNALRVDTISSPPVSSVTPNSAMMSLSSASSSSRFPLSSCSVSTMAQDSLTGGHTVSADSEEYDSFDCEHLLSPCASLANKHEDTSTSATSTERSRKCRDTKRARDAILTSFKNDKDRAIRAFKNAIEKLSDHEKPKNNDDQVTVSRSEYEALKRDAQIGQNVLNFHHEMRTKLQSLSGRSGDVSDTTLLAIMTAIVCPNGEKLMQSDSSIISRTKSSRATLRKARARRQQLKEATKPADVPFGELRCKK